MTPTTRRSVLAAVGVGLATAGCLTDSSGTPSDTEHTTTDDRRGSTTTDDPSATTDSPNTTTDGPSTTTDDSSTTGDWIEQASNEPDPDLPVYLNNEGSETRTVRVRVVRERTGETVFEETRESSGGTEYELYNLKQADPEGVEAFRVCGRLVDSSKTDATTTTKTTTSETTTGETTTDETTTAGETTTEDSETRDCVTVETNECYGTAHVTVQEDGSLQIIYSIC